MASPLLRINDLHAGYGRAEVLHGISLDAPEGSVITVIGPNGAGKSTLLNALMGVLPSHGGIEFQGQPIGALTLEERVMLGIALVPEKRELFGTMPVEDNLVLGAFRQVRLDGVDLAATELEDRVMMGMALVPERRELFGTMPVEDNLVLGGYRAMKQRVPNWRDRKSVV